MEHLFRRRTKDPKHLFSLHLLPGMTGLLSPMSHRPGKGNGTTQPRKPSHPSAQDLPASIGNEPGTLNFVDMGGSCCHSISSAHGRCWQAKAISLLLVLTVFCVQR